jgi:hypothetical protein
MGMPQFSVMTIDEAGMLTVSFVLTGTGPPVMSPKYRRLPVCFVDVSTMAMDEIEFPSCAAPATKKPDRAPRLFVAPFGGVPKVQMPEAETRV